MVVGLAVYAALSQALADRRNRRRIACFQRWESSIPLFLFGRAPPPAEVARLSRAEQAFFRVFLQRLRACLGGPEAEKLKELHALARLDRTVAARLRHRSPRTRALAAVEVGGFSLWSHLPEVIRLLDDPHPYVALAAARAIARSRDLGQAPWLVHWVLSQQELQRERLMLTLEQFGPELVPWLADNLPPVAREPLGWLYFALLAGSHRHLPSLGLLVRLLEVEDLELRCAAIRGLQALGDPAAYEPVAALAAHPATPVRIRATAALAPLGGPAAIPRLQALLADPVFEVRRHASHGLAALGPPGLGALHQIVIAPAADRFARDMAFERLQWIAARRPV